MVNQYKNILKKIKGDTANKISLLLTSRILAHGINLISGVIIARSLGAEGKGMITSAFIIPMFFASFGTFGLSASNVYYIKKKRDKETMLINSLLFFVIVSLVIIIGLELSLPLIKSVYYPKIDSALIIFLTFSLIFFQLIRQLLTDFFRGMNNFNTISLTRIIQDGAKLLLIVIFFFSLGITINAAVICTICSLICAVIYLFFKLSNYVKINFKKISFTQFKENICYGLKEYLGTLFEKLNTEVDLLILSAFIDKRSLGLYAVAIGLSNLFQMIPNTISFVLLPKFINNSQQRNDDLIIKGILSSTIPIFFLYIVYMIVGDYFIIFLYGKQFIDTFVLSEILILGILFTSTSNIINKYYSGIGHPEIKTKIRAINLPFKAFAMYILIINFGLIGAAWSFAVSNFIVLLLSYYYYLKNRKLVNM